MSVKLGGYRSKREYAKPSLTKVMLIIAESQFPWSKKSISMPFDTGVRGGWRIYKLVSFNMRKFQGILATCDFAFFYWSFA